MNICFARLRNVSHFKDYLEDMLDSFYFLIKEYIHEHPEHNYSFFNISLNSWDKPTADYESIKNADVVVIPSEGEFSWHIKNNMHTFDVAKSKAKIDEISKYIEGKDIIFLRSDRGDTEDLYRNHTFPNIKLGKFLFIDETDFPGNVHALKYYFIEDWKKLNNWDCSRKYRFFSYWGASNKVKVPITNENTGDLRHKYLGSIKKHWENKAFIIGRYPFKDMKFNRNFKKIIPYVDTAETTLCWNWMDPKATTSRYCEAIGLEIIPYVWENYDVENSYGEIPEQRISKLEVFYDAVENKKLEFADIKNNFLKTIVPKKRYAEMFYDYMNRSLNQL